MPPRCLALSGTLTNPSALFRNTRTTSRSFTSTSSVLAKDPLARKKGGDLGSHLPKYVIPQDVKVPEYPYGPSQLFKQQDKGLYGGKTIQFGNNVSRKTETKTRRYWKPNILSKSLYSVALKKKIKLRITSNVIKTIDREGGLDEYLLKQSENRIKELGPLGWALRWTLLQKPSVIRRMREDAAALGVPQEEIDAQWPEPAPVPAEALELAEEAAIEALANTEESLAASTRQEKAEKELRRTKTKIEAEAAKAYGKSIFVGNRYIKRGLVDTVEQGLKLAFLREESRAATRERNLALFKSRLEAKVGHKFKNEKEFQEAVEQYRKDIKKDIRAAGGYEAYRAKVNPEAAARRAAALEEAGSEQVLAAKLKEEALKEIRDAEKALTDERAPVEERLRIQAAFEKAQQIIDAGSKQAYMAEALARWEENNANQWPLNSVSSEEGLGESWEEYEQSGNAQGWDALVKETEKQSADSRPRV